MTGQNFKVVVFSGGTATNSLTPCFTNIANIAGSEVTYVLPISDNGGSTSEILRILGGPAIGDIRSRIIRIMEDETLSKLFGHRLADDALLAKQEWNDIVEGSHTIWKEVPVEVKEMCRAFIIHIQAELLKKSKNSYSFQFEKASVGNMFMTGARLFLGSLDASIELLMRIGRCNPNTFVIPCINSNHTHHISALLTNGDVITGQSQISHPSPIQNSNNTKKRTTRQAKKNDFLHIMKESQTAVELLKMMPSSSSSSSSTNAMVDNYTVATGTTAATKLERELDSMVEAEEAEEQEFANPVYILPELKNSQLHFDKVDENNHLPAPIKRILYINPYGEEIKPMGNSRAISKLKNANMIIYSVGSLMTSLMPIIILGNFADTIAMTKNAHKVLIVNNQYDRETSGIFGEDYIRIVVESMANAMADYREAKGLSIDPTTIKWNSFITDIIYLERGEIQMDWDLISTVHNIKCHKIEADLLENETLQQVLEMITQTSL
ncbi:similar to Saccharomyces cerevisiae YNL011C Putative protein of unknown function [Maudiozyma saulgeensis]|uniref:Uncharacterized protein n=1 Tax=Maudiozyma saulgeensis TaxID=1789683 RepID=A0A1X7RAF1_9SACH|nr:similar to Saccharomyces cerevisiae YNL011C Putative protein of unknown function [Kazachstania saulgeensis]